MLPCATDTNEAVIKVLFALGVDQFVRATSSVRAIVVQRPMMKKSLTNDTFRSLLRGFKKSGLLE